MILYTRTCPACTHRQLYRKLQQIARQRNVVIEERRVTRSPEWRAEAENYGVDFPFVLDNGKPVALNEQIELWRNHDSNRPN